MYWRFTWYVHPTGRSVSEASIPWQSFLQSHGDRQPDDGLVEKDQSSQHESSPPQSSPSDSSLLYSPQIQSPASALSPEPISKAPQTQPNTMVGYPQHSSLFFPHDLSLSGCLKVGMNEPSLFASSFETPPASDVHFMKQASFQVNVANGFDDIFVLETMNHTP